MWRSATFTPATFSEKSLKTHVHARIGILRSESLCSHVATQVFKTVFRHYVQKGGATERISKVKPFEFGPIRDSDLVVMYE